MPIIGDYPEFYVNYKGEKVKRLPDSQLPKLAPGMDDPYTSRNINMRETYNANRRVARMKIAKMEREKNKNNSNQ